MLFIKISHDFYKTFILIGCLHSIFSVPIMGDVRSQVKPLIDKTMLAREQAPVLSLDRPVTSVAGLSQAQIDKLIIDLHTSNKGLKTFIHKKEIENRKKMKTIAGVASVPTLVGLGSIIGAGAVYKLKLKAKHQNLIQIQRERFILKFNAELKSRYIRFIDQLIELKKNKLLSEVKNHREADETRKSLVGLLGVLNVRELPNLLYHKLSEKTAPKVNNILDQMIESISFATDESSKYKNFYNFLIKAQRGDIPYTLYDLENSKQAFIKKADWLHGHFKSLQVDQAFDQKMSSEDYKSAILILRGVKDVGSNEGLNIDEAQPSEVFYDAHEYEHGINPLMSEDLTLPLELLFDVHQKLIDLDQSFVNSVSKSETFANYLLGVGVVGGVGVLGALASI